MSGPVQLLEGLAAPTGPDWLNDARRTSAQFVQSAGLPTRRDENWKYTSLKDLAGRQFELPDSDGLALAPEDLAEFTLAGVAMSRIVFVNGQFAPGLSLLPADGAITVRSLKQLDAAALATYRARLEQTFASSDTALAALNTAMASDGLVVDVAVNGHIESALECVMLDVERSPERNVSARHLISLGAGARLTLIERQISLGESRNLSNQVIQVALGESSALTHVRLQQMAAGSTLVTRSDIEQASASEYRYFGLDLGGGLVRHDINCRLAGAGAFCDLSGSYRLGGKAHVDIHTRTDHVAPAATSREWFKGVLDDHSRAVFNGKVVVHAGADGTDAGQSNANLLLSAHCEVDTKPELEIYADDVKCAHGATVGQLDDQQLFYMRSRGLDDAVARNLLTRAFCAEVLTQIADLPLRQAIADLLDQPDQEAEL